MSKFVVEIQTDNAAFAEARGEAIATTLEQCVAKVRFGFGKGVLHDPNGNRVGMFHYFDDSKDSP